MKMRMIVIPLVLLMVVLLAIPETSHGQRRGWPERGRGPAPSNTLPVPREGQEKKILDVLEDMATNQTGMLNVSMDDGRLLRLLAETIGAKHVVEIGTSNGYSSLWLLMALRTTGGKLTTFEIDSEKVRLAANNFKKAGVDHLVTIIEGNAHEEVKSLKGSIDLLFIDADKDGYLDYLNKLLPLIRPGGLIVSHNMNSLNWDYINALTTNPDLETLVPNQYMDIVGITLKKR